MSDNPWMGQNLPMAIERVLSLKESARDKANLPLDREYLNQGAPKSAKKYPNQGSQLRLRPSEMGAGFQSWIRARRSWNVATSFHDGLD
jgi:hypothetical protein